MESRGLGPYCGGSASGLVFASRASRVAATEGHPCAHRESTRHRDPRTHTHPPVPWDLSARGLALVGDCTRPSGAFENATWTVVSSPCRD